MKNGHYKTQETDHKFTRKKCEQKAELYVRNMNII